MHPVQTDRYVLSGSRRQSWEPRFSYKGFRYVEISSSFAPTHEVVRARSVHTSVEPAGTFACSDALFAWLHEATGRTILNNLHGIPTDTPLFEKNGWTADAHLIAEAAIHQFDMHLFFRKWLCDLTDAQADDGGIPVVVPTPGWGASADPCWSTAHLLIAWNLFEYYADTDLLDEHYAASRKYVEHLHATCRPTGWIWPRFSYADWLAPGHKFAPEGPKLAASAFVYLATRRLADIAEVLEHHDDAERYAQTAGEIGLAFNRAFLDAASATYRSAPGEAYRQTSNVLPLAFGLVPGDAAPAVVANAGCASTSRACDPPARASKPSRSSHSSTSASRPPASGIGPCAARLPSPGSARAPASSSISRFRSAPPRWSTSPLATAIW